MSKCLFSLLFTVMACTHHLPSNEGEDARLDAIVTTYTEATKRLDPFFATYFNVEADLSRFGDYATPAYFERSQNIYLTALASLKGIDPERLSPSARLTYEVFREDVEISLEALALPERYLDFNQMSNRLLSYMNDTNEALTSFPFDTVRHYEAFSERARGFLPYVEAQMEILREGVRRGVTLSCTVAAKIPSTYHEALESRVEKNPFFRPILFMPKHFSENDKLRLTELYREMIRTQILPGYKKFDRYFRQDYRKHCRPSFGLSAFPNAQAWYRHAIRASTNLDWDAKLIHEKGLAEVARIRTEMNGIRQSLGFRGDLKAFLHALVSNEKFYFRSAQEIFRAFRETKIEVQKLLPQYFSKLPRTDYELAEAPNPQDAAASYFQPTENNPRGRFIVNTKSLRSVPIYEINTLSLHESAPGHHFQLARQFEMKSELSEYRRKIYSSNAFVEGWALYAEYLGLEMGLYRDPLQRLGNLNDDMLRAVRLVVDTGIHAYGWSQKKAIDYMTRHLAMDAAAIEIEVNRYSVWPGQALGYKLGQLKIIELRRLAEKMLGEKFRLKDFHEVVIGQGTVSLSVLEKNVRAWIASAATP